MENGAFHLWVNGFWLIGLLMAESHCFHLSAVWSQREVSWWSAIGFSCASVAIQKSAAGFTHSVSLVLFRGDDQAIRLRDCASRGNK